MQFGIHGQGADPPELLVKHGLWNSVLWEFGAIVEELGAAVRLAATPPRPARALGARRGSFRPRAPD
jgi:hypothetical protein